MRSGSDRLGRAGALAAALALAGCGDLSNDDVAFREALPDARALRLSVPAPPGQPLCGDLGEAAVWKQARPTSDGLRAGVDRVLQFVDAVRAHAPTTRRRDQRVWGPFDDARHPQREVRIEMTRSRDPGGALAYAYAFQARAKGTEAWHLLLSGRFVGGSARTGRGELTVRFGLVRLLGMNVANEPEGDVQIAYDRTSDPRTISIDLRTARGFGLADFGYEYAGYLSGAGWFEYAFVNAAGDELEVSAGFTPGGAGRAHVATRRAGGGSGAFQVCWDDAGCTTRVDDPQGRGRICSAILGVPCVRAGVCPDVPMPAGTPALP